MQTFDGWEIAHVGEDAEGVCERVSFQDSIEAPGSFVSFHWTLYGIVEGIAEVIVDREGQWQACDMLQKITGKAVDPFDGDMRLYLRDGSVRRDRNDYHVPRFPDEAPKTEQWWTRDAE